MAIDFNHRAGSPTQVSEFEVFIPSIGLVFGVDSVSGLGAGTISTVSHRRSGNLDGHKQHYPMLVETPVVTFTGLYLPDLIDAKQLLLWHRRSAGVIDDVTKDLVLKRDIEITPVFRDWDGNIISSTDSNSPGRRSLTGGYTLINAFVTDLNFSEFNINTADASKWTLSVKFEKLEIVPGIGV